MQNSGWQNRVCSFDLKKFLFLKRFADKQTNSDECTIHICSLLNTLKFTIVEEAVISIKRYAGFHLVFVHLIKLDLKLMFWNCGSSSIRKLERAMVLEQEQIIHRNIEHIHTNIQIENIGIQLSFAVTFVECFFLCVWEINNPYILQI